MQEPKFKVGDKVYWIGGDYTDGSADEWSGTILRILYHHTKNHITKEKEISVLYEIQPHNRILNEIFLEKDN